jgi:hypothetical protein
MFKQKTPPPPPTITAPPPPEKAPAELENAVDSNAVGLKKKRKGAKGSLGRGSVGAQYKGAASGSGLTINK